MSYYPPAGSHHTVVYPGTPLPASNYLAPQQLTPNIVYVPSRSSSRNSHRHEHDYDHRHDHRDDHHRHDRRRSHSRSRKHSHRHDDDSDDHRRHRTSRRHRRRDRDVPQIITVPAQVPGMPMMSPHAPATYYYRPTWTQRLRQFFGFAPVSPHYKHKSNTHSWGFFGRSRRPRYVDAYTGAEVDRHGRPVYRV